MKVGLPLLRKIINICSIFGMPTHFKSMTTEWNFELFCFIREKACSDMYMCYQTDLPNFMKT